jgi:tetratricopeptide (TPR) repeat protein
MLKKDYEMAIDFFLKSIECKHSLFGERHISMVRTYNLMGVTYHMMEQPDKAIESYEHGVWIYA